MSKFNIYFCTNCNLGFTYPLPKKLDKYYHANYWMTPGLIGGVKDFLFKTLQRRRTYWVRKYLREGKILDVGAGEGNFAKNSSDIYDIVSIDSPNAKIQNPDVKRVDFLKWKSKTRFNMVVFWESLEHTTNPRDYLKKAYQLLNKRGLVLIEYPRFNSLESKLFGRYWFHLDTPRHSFHITDDGLKKLLKRRGFTSVERHGVPAFEYALWGFIASFLNIFNPGLTDKLKRSRNISIMIVLIPLGILAFISEVLFLVLNQSPIGLAVARKDG